MWAWVPYEDDPSQGKDRPVLVLDTDGDGWVGLMLSSQDHDRDAADEARYGRHWMDVGTGGWDSQGRPSEVRLDRLIRLERDGVRREGAALDETIFTAVVDGSAWSRPDRVCAVVPVLLPGLRRSALLALRPRRSR